MVTCQDCRPEYTIHKTGHPVQTGAIVLCPTHATTSALIDVLKDILAAAPTGVPGAQRYLSTALKTARAILAKIDREG